MYRPKRADNVITLKETNSNVDLLADEEHVYIDLL